MTRHTGAHGPPHRRDDPSYSSTRAERYTRRWLAWKRILSALNRVETRVLDLVAFLSGALGIVCTAMFLFLIDYAARLLRPVSIAARVGDEELPVIGTLYSIPEDRATARIPESRGLGGSPRSRQYSSNSGPRCREM